MSTEIPPAILPKTPSKTKCPIALKQKHDHLLQWHISIFGNCSPDLAQKFPSKVHVIQPAKFIAKTTLSRHSMTPVVQFQNHIRTEIPSQSWTKPISSKSGHNVANLPLIKMQKLRNWLHSAHRFVLRITQPSSSRLPAVRHSIAVNRGKIRACSETRPRDMTHRIATRRPSTVMTMAASTRCASWGRCTGAPAPPAASQCQCAK